MLADCSHMAGHYFHETWKLQICAADFKNILYSFRCFCVSHGIPRSKIVIWFGSMDYRNLLLWLLFQNNVIYYDLFIPITPYILVLNENLYVPDIRECNFQAGAFPCHVNADCTETFGSYICQCKDGFTGNGLICEGNYAH